MARTHPGLESGPRAPLEPLRIGIISDTHGLLRPAVRHRLVGCDYIFHAGDVGDSNILDALAAIAPLIVVKGNNDTAPPTSRLRKTELVRVANTFVYMIHDLADLDVDLDSVRAKVVISGHSHRPSVEQRGGILFVNPGSCGPRRFKLPISMAELTVAGDAVRAHLCDLTGEIHAGDASHV